MNAIARAIASTLAAVDLAGRVRNALPPRPPPRARVRVIAAGKAAPAMVRGALERWPECIERVLVVLPDATPCELVGDRIEVVRAAHPLPDSRSVAAASAALELARGTVSDLLVVLVSGGASSLLCAPAPPVTLDDKRACTQALLASGASIVEVNTVRRHLSRIKGGGLTRAAAPGRVLALLVSDVLAGHPFDIGSGPTLVDPTTVADARRALERRAPAFARLPTVETLKPREPEARRQRARVVASPADFVELMASALAREGYRPRVLPPSVDGVDALANEYVEASRSLEPGRALVRAAEPAVVVPSGSGGRGGRASHLAALVAPALAPNVVFLAGATDGVDGSSSAAGAVVDATSPSRVREGRWKAGVAAFDTAALHEQAGTALATGPTGLNFADVHVLANVGGLSSPRP